MTDRELLERLFGFMKARTYVGGDEASVRDMVLRYQQPPLTMHFRVAMQMTVPEYNDLGVLCKQIEAHLKETETEHADPEPV